MSIPNHSRGGGAIVLLLEMLMVVLCVCVLIILTMINLDCRKGVERCMVLWVITESWSWRSVSQIELRKIPLDFFDSVLFVFDSIGGVFGESIGDDWFVFKLLRQ